MRVKMKFSEMAPGSCFQRGKSEVVRKKTPDGRVVSVTGTGRERVRDIKGDPSVYVLSCPLDLLGVGMRKNPGAVIEIGSSRRR